MLHAYSTFCKNIRKEKTQKELKKKQSRKKSKTNFGKNSEKTQIWVENFFFWSKKVYASPKMCLFLVQNMFSGFKMTIPDPKHL